MRELLVIGVGVGDPAQITVEAIEALNAADVIFEIDRGTQELTLAREELCRRHLTPGRAPKLVVVAEPRRDRGAVDYAGAVEAWRTARADTWEAAIRGELGEDETGAFLVWGDPSLYDSTVAVLEQIAERGRVRFEYRVIPGVSSIHALTARHRITLNYVAGAVLITTGRRLVEGGIPDDIDNVVVMLDAGSSFRRVAGEPFDIYWGAYLGTEDELLVAGPIDQVAEEIERVRAEARERKGWVMDCYLLRRR